MISNRWFGGLQIAVAASAIAFSQALPQAVSPHTIDSLARVGSEKGFIEQVKAIGCAPMQPLVVAHENWGDALQRRAEEVRATILGEVPKGAAGKVQEVLPYVDNDSYLFSRIVISSRILDVPTFAYLMEPKGTTGREPIVLLLHGSGTLPHQGFGLRLNGEGGSVTRPDSTPLIGMGLALARAGFTVLAPIIGRVQSQSSGALPWTPTSLVGEILREKTGRGGPETFLLAELEAYVDYAASRGFGKNRAIYIVGWNEGAYLGSLLASRDERVQGLVRLEAPYDRKAYRNSTGLFRDAGFLHAECAFGDVAQASLLRDKALMYAAANDDANVVARRAFRSNAITDSLHALFSGTDHQGALKLEVSGLSSSKLQQAVVGWLAEQSHLSVRPLVPYVAPRLPVQVRFPADLITERTNAIGSYLGLLRSCPTLLPQVQAAPNDPQAIAQLIKNNLNALPHPTAQSILRSRKVLDASRGYRLSLVEYGVPTGRRWQALLAEPLAAGPHPAVVSFNGIDNLDDLFAIGIPPRQPYLSGYGDELARRGFVVLVPVVPYWVPNTFAAVSSARSLGKSSVWRILIETYQNAIDILVDLPDVDPQRVAGYGISFGGMAAAVVTAVDPRIKALVFSNVPGDYQTTFDRPSGAFSTLWLANVCSVADAALVAVAPRPFIWEAGEDPLMENPGLDVIARIRARYRQLGHEEAFSFTRHSGGHTTYPVNLRIFGR